MKTIDELVCKIAENTGAAGQAVHKAAEKPKDKKHLCAGQAEGVHNSTLTLEDAKKIAAAVEIAAGIIGVNAVAAVCDEGANLMLLHAMDGSYIASRRAAQDKAYTAVALQMPTHIALCEARGGSLDGLTNGNGILLLGGGFPLEGAGKIYGGVGVSGGTKEQDTLLAAAAAEIFKTLSAKNTDR